ncbi:MAG: iron complex outermembrane receptor protein [Arenicella sp.]|jgi:iron complex outermembrane receptor protein
MKQFKPSLIKAALITSGFSFGISSALAQESSEATTEGDIEVIQVSGLRGSIIESINTKRFSSSVVEAITAEDIGKLPDSSIAESIARLPGLTAQRLDGRASRVSIRGFGENESGTTFNGREQVSISDNRGVEFDLYPSEIMSGVTVYKTPNASLEAEGIAGIINMETIKPLSIDDRVIQLNGQYEKTSFGKLNPDGDDSGFRGTFSYIDKFNNDTLGVALAVTGMSSPNQEKRWNSWGYPEFTYPDGSAGSILGGAKPYVRSSTLDRDSAMLVVQYAPTNDVEITFDALYVDFTDHKILRGIEIPFAWGQGAISADTAVIDTATGFVTAAITDGQRVVVRNDYEDRKAKMTNLGFNTKYTLSDDLMLNFDASYSKVDRDIWSVESYSGTGRGDNNGAADSLGYEFDGGNTGAHFTHGLDYGDYDLIKLGGPLTWGWSSALNDKFGISGTPLENSAQDGFINAPSINDELTALKLAAEQSIDTEILSGITYGVSYRSREKEKKSEGFFMTLNAFPDMLTVPEQYREGSASLEFIGMGDMIAYNTSALIDDGFYDLTRESTTNSTHATKSWTVGEKVTSAFIQGEIDTEVGGLSLTGNVGVRYVHTKQDSQGSAFSVVDGLVVSSPTDVNHSYSDVLPSLNLSLKIDHQQIVRFGAAKTLSRARMDEMNASVNASYSQTPDDNGNNWNVNGGNPALEPKEATGLDLTYENYFSDEGYFSTAIFYKDLSTWIFDGTYEVVLEGVAIPGTNTVPANATASGSGKQNGGGGDLWGYELSLTLPFKIFSESLDGFGFSASYTGVKSDIKDLNGNDFELPGLSESISNMTVYYEKNGFQFRTSIRSRGDFKGDVYGLGFDTVQVDIIGETIVDAQIAYDFGEAGYEGLDGLSIFLSGANLTNEPFTSLQGDNHLQVRDYQDYGKTYLLGVSYKL